MLSALTSLPSCSKGIMNQTACCLNAEEEYAKNSRCLPARSKPSYDGIRQTPDTVSGVRDTPSGRRQPVPPRPDAYQHREHI